MARSAGTLNHGANQWGDSESFTSGPKPVVGMASGYRTDWWDHFILRHRLHPLFTQGDTIALRQ